MLQLRRRSQGLVRLTFIPQMLSFLFLTSTVLEPVAAHAVTARAAETRYSDPPITLTERSIALADLAKVVSKAGRSRVRVSPSLGDLKVTVAVRRMPPDAFRASLAAAVDGLWRVRQREDSTTYQLERDARTILRAMETRESQTKKIAHDLWHRTRQFVDSPQPIAEEMRGISAAAALIAGLGNAHWDEIIRGRPLAIPFRQVHHELSEPLRTVSAQLRV